MCNMYERMVAVSTRKCNKQYQINKIQANQQTGMWAGMCGGMCMCGAKQNRQCVKMRAVHQQCI
jgi:hypothetical protein